jgi:hypothetical protein
MAGRGQGQGQGQGAGHGQGRHEPAGSMRERRDDGTDRTDANDAGDASTRRDDERGRSEDSPGHRKQDAGVQSARDFAPGRQRRG